MHHLLASIRLRAVLLTIALVVVAIPARADEPPADATAAARAAFDEGVAALRDVRWGEALAAFERAHALKPHALTAYNMGVAERSLGRLTRSRARFREALDRNEAAQGKELAGTIAEDARALLAEVENRLVRIEVTLDRTDAGFSVDGRPVAPDPWEKDLLVAGLLPPGTDVPVNAPRVVVLADPGRHVLSATRQGYVTATSEADHRPGSRSSARLSLIEQDTELSIDCEVKNAAVRVDGVDVGIAPLVLRRPAGKHAVEVRAQGYQVYSTAVVLQAGERSSLLARLKYEETTVFKRPVFWVALGGTVVTVAAVVTYLLLPVRPYDGGSTGWVAQPR